MGVKVTGQSALEASLDPGRLMRRVRPVMQKVLEEGRDIMVGHIETRGTGRQWQSPWGNTTRSASIPGRDDTGVMKNAVEGEVTSVTPTHVEGVLGWPEGSPEYFAMQEDQFYNRLSRETVEGMHALRDASEETTQNLVHELIQLARRL